MNKELTIDNLYTKYLNDLNQSEKKLLSNMSKYNDDDENYHLELQKLKHYETRKKKYFFKTIHLIYLIILNANNKSKKIKS